MLKLARTISSCLALLALSACGDSQTVVGNNAEEIRQYREQRDNAQKFRDAIVRSMNHTTELMSRFLSDPNAFTPPDAYALKSGMENIKLAGQASDLFGKPMSEPLGWCTMLGLSAGQAIEETIRSISETDRKQWAEKSIQAYQNNISDCDRQLQNPPKPQVFIQTSKSASAPRRNCEPEALLKPAEQDKMLWRCDDDSVSKS
ncbi:MULTISPECIES: hypothetical protein [Burkholderia cepacia complex]|jgi:hypothetical protein|uniref:Hypothetical phage protein n=1 Tax=Burkholderia cenocepacia (strain ATCC BAA-245 / DSM 16553 / LMG 16656 / NCTC 13227 / J2315 / CF5610) TaxID=216591 RepID=B4E893_BURCJ|nr:MULTISPECIES: hypothetical protein [Burkholderia cepacia complex]YP_002221427.1 hypothetical protein KS10_gp11 [Burkholderia phage KS10]KIS46803.1 hypothetical protein NP88_5589 [Burkholderia cepacia]ACH72930.1 gp11 [Burkholderia phage KS10]ONR63348.1 hypothetical protein A8E17_08930 [Burkholderia cenocepacia]ONR72558.1 hypothetical protein A8E18_14635 [Burkholderia cenocepacia]ONR76475.1 hypothetical protein A8E22_24035 [Burkholderia cenocepacia]